MRGEVKVFLIKGKIVKGKPKEPLIFIKKVKALRKEDALEKIYSLMGSRHKAKRSNIRIESIEILEEEEGE